MKVRIDYGLCMGDRNCHKVCPEVFDFDEDQLQSIVRVDIVPAQMEDKVRFRTFSSETDTRLGTSPFSKEARQPLFRVSTFSTPMPPWLGFLDVLRAVNRLDKRNHLIYSFKVMVSRSYITELCNTFSLTGRCF